MTSPGPDWIPPLQQRIESLISQRSRLVIKKHENDAAMHAEISIRGWEGKGPRRHIRWKYEALEAAIDEDIEQINAEIAKLRSRQMHLGSKT